MTNKEFVEAIYKNSLGKAGDTEGIKHWTKYLDSGNSRSDMVSDFMETSLTIELSSENFPNLTTQELSIAQKRQDYISNKVEVALKFTTLLGTKTNVANSNFPENDPAYLASIKILSNITDSSNSVSIAIDFLDSIKNDKNPIERINNSIFVGENNSGSSSGSSGVSASNPPLNSEETNTQNSEISGYITTNKLINNSNKTTLKYQKLKPSDFKISIFNQNENFIAKGAISTDGSYTIDIPINESIQKSKYLILKASNGKKELRSLIFGFLGQEKYSSKETNLSIETETAYLISDYLDNDFDSFQKFLDVYNKNSFDTKSDLVYSYAYRKIFNNVRDKIKDYFSQNGSLPTKDELIAWLKSGKLILKQELSELKDKKVDTYSLSVLTKDNEVLQFSFDVNESTINEDFEIKTEIKDIKDGDLELKVLEVDVGDNILKNVIVVRENTTNMSSNKKNIKANKFQKINIKHINNQTIFEIVNKNEQKMISSNLEINADKTGIKGGNLYIDFKKVLVSDECILQAKLDIGSEIKIKKVSQSSPIIFDNLKQNTIYSAILELECPPSKIRQVWGTVLSHDLKTYLTIANIETVNDQLSKTNSVIASKNLSETRASINQNNSNSHWNNLTYTHETGDKDDTVVTNEVLTHRIIDFDKVLNPLESIPNETWNKTSYAKSDKKGDNRRIPILLIHGWQGDRGLRDPAQLGLWKNSELHYWEHWLSYYLTSSVLQEKYHVYLYHYTSYKHVTYNAHILDELLKEIKDKKNSDLAKGLTDTNRGVVIIGHSMGGLVARSLIEEHKGLGDDLEYLRKLITLDTPHHGTRVSEDKGVSNIPKDLSTHGAIDLNFDYFDYYKGNPTQPIWENNQRRWRTEGAWSVNAKEFDSYYWNKIEKTLNTKSGTIYTIKETSNPYLSYLNSYFHKNKNNFKDKYIFYTAWIANGDEANQLEFINSDIGFNGADEVIGSIEGKASGGAESVGSSFLASFGLPIGDFFNPNKNTFPMIKDGKLIVKDEKAMRDLNLYTPINYLNNIFALKLKEFHVNRFEGYFPIIIISNGKEHPYNIPYRLFWDYDHETIINGVYKGDKGIWNKYININTNSNDSNFFKKYKHNYVNSALNYRYGTQEEYFNKNTIKQANPLTNEPVFLVMEKDLLNISYTEPTIKIKINKTSFEKGETIYFSSEIIDPNKKIASVAWIDFWDDEVITNRIILSNDNQFTTSSLALGTHIIRVYAKDKNGKDLLNKDGIPITDSITINIGITDCTKQSNSNKKFKIYKKIDETFSSTQSEELICSNPSKAPTIKLNGSPLIEITKGDAYIELNATAYDEEDGNLTDSIVIDSSEVDTSIVGSYKVYYRVTDSEYIQVEMTRTVDVIDKKECQNSATPPNGLFTITTIWQNQNASLLTTNPLMQEQSKSCTSYNIGSGELTLDEVYQGHYAIEVNPTNLASIDSSNLPDIVTVTINTPTGTRVYKKEIKTKDDYNLGHIADIFISRADPTKPATVETVPTQTSLPTAGGSSGGYGGEYQFVSGGGASWSSYPPSSLGSSVTTINEIRNIEKEMCVENAKSCGCIPCEYRVLTFLNQAQLGGAIAGAKYRIYKASDFGKKEIEYLYEGGTTVGTDIDSSGIIYLPVVLEGRVAQTADETSFMQKIAGYDGDFIIEVMGGVDIDANSDFEMDSDYTPLKGTIHAIVSKEELLRDEYKVNILTELSFEVSKDLLGANYDRYGVDDRLNGIAKSVLIEKLYPKSANPLGRDDILYWLASANQNWLVKDYATQLLPIIQKAYRGEDLSTDAESFIYAKPSTTSNPKPILGATWVQVSEDTVGVYELGKVKVLSEGSSAISSYEIVSQDSIFEIDNSGVVSLKAGESLDYEVQNQYDILLKASNSSGESRPVKFRVIVSDIVDSPIFTEFKDGHIAEDATVGVYVGQVIFTSNKGAITGYTISGTNKDEFTIDESGKIFVSYNADLDFEKYRVKHIEVTALSDSGNSRPQRITIFIDDVLDVPSITPKEVHIAEDVVGGSLITQLDIASPIAVDSVTVVGEYHDIFDITTDGKLSLATNATLDYETKRDYIFSVVATNANGTSRPASIHVVVDNKLDVPVLSATSAEVDFEASVGHAVVQVGVTNQGLSAIKSYQLTGVGSDNFEIDSSGIITISATQHLADYQFSTLNMVVTATNEHGTSQPQRVSIYVKSNRPLLGQLNTYVDENALEGTSLNAIPIISTATPIISMRLEGSGSENFVIENDGTIKVKAGADIDFEKRTAYDLRAYATNSAGESQASLVHIRIYDMDDSIKIKGFSGTVYDDSEANSLVGIVHIVSLGGHTLNGFELTGEGNSNFLLGSNGELRVASNAEFDSTKTAKYHLSLVAIDESGNKSNMVYLDISVVKSIDSVPQVEDISFSVQESVAVGDLVGSVKIVSKIRVVEQVWIEGVGSDDFEIDKNGVIKVKKTLDFETQQEYNLKIYARNSLGQSLPASLHITVGNIIDDEPILADTNLTISENVAIGTTIGKIEIKSIGSSPIKAINLSGIGAESFEVDREGNITTTKVIDYEATKKYLLKAIATNDKAHSEAVDVNITIRNIAEIKPILYEFKGYIEENATAGRVIGTVGFATKGDSEIVGFSLTGDGSENFEIGSDGIIKVSSTAQFDETTKNIIL